MLATLLLRVPLKATFVARGIERFCLGVARQTLLISISPFVWRSTETVGKREVRREGESKACSESSDVLAPLYSVQQHNIVPYTVRSRGGTEWTT